MKLSTFLSAHNFSLRVERVGFNVFRATAIYQATPVVDKGTRKQIMGQGNTAQAAVDKLCIEMQGRQVLGLPLTSGIRMTVAAPEELESDVQSLQI